MKSEPRTKRRRPKLALMFGSLLMLGAVATTVGWFYFLSPRLHQMDRYCMAEHSVLARWNEEQRMYRRLGTSPDLMFRPDKIPFYGNKAWFEWLLGRVNDGSSDFRVCGCTFSCLSYMANHDFDSEMQWNQWYMAHKGETQEEWLQAGFADRNVKIALPPSASDAEALLSLMGRISEGPPRPGDRLQSDFDAPGYIRYNAFRWLRDMGFDGAGYLIDHRMMELRAEIISGVRQYLIFERQYPVSNGVGILAFGPRPSNPLDDFPPRVTPATVTSLTVYGLIAVFGVGGLCLFRRGLRMLHLKSALASPTSHQQGTEAGPKDH